MHDANYNIIFSDVVNRFNYSHGLSLKERENLAYTLFTLEEHTTYLLRIVSWRCIYCYFIYL